MKNTLTYFIISFLLLSCFYNKNDKKESYSLNDEIKTDNLINNKSKNFDQKLQFDEFWKEIRSAILSSNYDKLIINTKFPLQITGYDDNDIPIYVEKEDVVKVYQYFFEMPEAVYFGDKLMSHKNYIKSKINIDDIDFSRDYLSVRIENLEFEYQSSNKWLIVNLYMGVYDEFWNNIKLKLNNDSLSPTPQNAKE